MQNLNAKLIITQKQWQQWKCKRDQYKDQKPTNKREQLIRSDHTF